MVGSVLEMANATDIFRKHLTPVLEGAGLVAYSDRMLLLEHPLRCMVLRARLPSCARWPAARDVPRR